MYLHVFRVADVVSLVGLCSKDIDVRQASVLTLVDLAKLKRLMIKKEHWTPLLDDVLYLNQTKLIKTITVKMSIMNGIRGIPRLKEEQIRELSFYQLMIDNFEYSKAGL
jgi:hypothetical protein